MTAVRRRLPSASPRARLRVFRVLVMLLAACGTGAASAGPAEAGDAALGAALERNRYQLVDPLPLASLSAGADARWQIESAIGLGSRQQLRLTSSAAGLALTPAWLSTSPLSPMLGSGPRFDSRATWRYTVMERPGWAWRVGLTAPLGDRDPRRLTLASDSRVRFGSLPMLHMAGETSLAARWHLGVDADGLMTARGRAFELGLRVSYQLAPNLAVTGGYRLSDGWGDGEEVVGAGLSNSANVGLRLRF